MSVHTRQGAVRRQAMDRKRGFDAGQGRHGCGENKVLDTDVVTSMGTTQVDNDEKSEDFLREWPAVGPGTAWERRLLTETAIRPRRR